MVHEGSTGFHTRTQPLQTDASFGRPASVLGSTGFFSRRHPDIAHHVHRHIWRFFLDSYVGGHVYVYGLNRPRTHRAHSYLHNHSREHKEDYRDRIQRAYYLNYCKTIVDIYVSTIFKKEVSRTTTSSDIKNFWNDVDRQGTRIDDYWREEVAVMSQVLGTQVVVVDMPSNPEGFASRQQEIDAGFKPYLSTVFPGDLIDYVLDENGDFEWVAYMELGPDTREPGDPADSNSLEDRMRFKVWTKTDWTLFDRDGNKIGGAEHHVGRVPVVLVINERTPYLEILGKSALEDIAFINREIFNVSSLEQEYIYRQCFPFLAWPMDDIAEEGRVKIGTGNFIPYPAQGSPGQYITPPTEPLKAQLEYQDKLREEIFRAAIVGGAEVEAGVIPSSGVAKAFDFHSQNQNIVRKARNLEAGERDIIDIVNRWMTGGDPVTPEIASVIYPTDFNIRAINDELGEAIQTIALNLGPTVNFHLKRRLANTIIPNLTEADALQVEKELKKIELTQAALMEAEVDGAMRDLTEPPEPPEPPEDEPPEPPEPEE